MKIKVDKYTDNIRIGYSVFYKPWYCPFWLLFLYGYNEGGGRYFILEKTKEDALRIYEKEARITDIREDSNLAL